MIELAVFEWNSTLLADFNTIAITDGYSSTSRLNKAKPDVPITKLPDIVNNNKGVINYE
jgi:hypothetical protein